LPPISDITDILHEMVEKLNALISDPSQEIDLITMSQHYQSRINTIRFFKPSDIWEKAGPYVDRLHTLSVLEDQTELLRSHVSTMGKQAEELIDFPESHKELMESHLYLSEALIGFSQALQNIKQAYRSKILPAQHTGQAQ
jgi:hypothetical protein